MRTGESQRTTDREALFQLWSRQRRRRGLLRLLQLLPGMDRGAAFGGHRRVRGTPTASTIPARRATPDVTGPAAAAVRTRRATTRCSPPPTPPPATDAASRHHRASRHQTQAPTRHPLPAAAPARPAVQPAPHPARPPLVPEATRAPGRPPPGDRRHDCRTSSLRSSDWSTRRWPA